MQYVKTEVGIHPLYSSNIAFSEHYVFLHANSILFSKFNISLKGLIKSADSFLVSKSTKRFYRGTKILPKTRKNGLFSNYHFLEKSYLTFFVDTTF